MRRRLSRLGLTFLVLAVGLVMAAPAQASRDRPSRVLIVVLDQMRPEYVDLFDMDNVRMLSEDGVDYRDAYLGHMGSETVITHNVLTTGVLPKNMGWSDEVHRDVGNVLLEGPGAFFVTSSLSRDQFFDLQTASGVPRLGDFLHDAFPGTKFITVGEKTTATYTSGGPSADIIVTLSGRNFDCAGAGNTYRGPTGVAVPTYLSAPSCGRYYIDSNADLDYGTRTTCPACMYPEDGNRFVPGLDPAHLGGDTWVADAAMAMMNNEPWSGMLVSFGGIDKIGHMWGGITDTGVFPSPVDQVHERFIAKNADEQVGRLISNLRASGQLDETLIVLTTDHAGNPALNFHGLDAPGRSNFNWYYGRDADETYLMPQPQLAPLIATGNVAFNYQDSAVRTWLIDQSTAKKREAAAVMATLPSVIASYYRRGDRYVLYTTDTSTPMTKAERKWWKQHAQELVNTMAAPFAADVVGLLRDNASYGVAGDHGGAQEPVQQIPIIFWADGLKSGATPAYDLRSVDILPTVLRELGIKRGKGFDGRAIQLPRR
jgi:hypothetical protein